MRNAATMSDRELDCLRALCYRLLKTQRWEEARSVAVGLAAMAPGDSFACTALGAASEHCGRSSEAQGAYERAVRRDPTDAAAHLNLGRMRLRAGDHERALGDLRTAWALSHKKNREIALMASQLIEYYERADRRHATFSRRDR